MKLRRADILRKARSEGRIVLTFDLDFKDLLIASGDTFPSVTIFSVTESDAIRGESPALFRIIRMQRDD